MGWGNKTENEKKECNCCIKIEDSFVLIVCSGLDIAKLKDSLKTFLEVKGNTELASQE